MLVEISSSSSLASAPRSRPEHDAQTLGRSLKFLRAGAIADLLDLEIERDRRRRRQRLEDGRAGGRHHLGLAVAHPDREPVEQFNGGRRGHRNDCHAASARSRCPSAAAIPAAHRLPARRGPGRPHDIDDRIDRADLVKMHLLRAWCDGPSLRPRRAPRKSRRARCFDRRRQRALLDAWPGFRRDGAQAEASRPRPRTSTAEIPLSSRRPRRNPYPRNSSDAMRQLELCEVDPGVEQRADQHVAAQSRKSIEIGGQP